MVLPTSDIILLQRIVYRACAALEKKNIEEQDEVPLAQVYRLIEQYRYDAFDWRDSHEKESSFYRHYRIAAENTVRSAMAQAGNLVFPGLTREEIAVRTEAVLSAYALGKSVDLAETKKFLALLADELKQK